jgi:hypothetical protein
MSCGNAVMPTLEHLVLCGEVHQAGRTGGGVIRLRLHGPHENIRLLISDISRRLRANIPDVIADLIEVASYVYSADSAVRRTDARLGARWRRSYRFVVPVRQPQLWSSDSVSSALSETLAFLSDDEYSFEFCKAEALPPTEAYFELPTSDRTAFTPDRVMLFSGGLDSLGGAVEALKQGENLALVSHRSSPKITDAQKFLVTRLRDCFGAHRIRHIPVWMTLKSGVNRERTHRVRSFLYAAIGAATAVLFGLNCIFFFENGVVSLNLPFTSQVVGARATRTTHPQVLAGFRRILSNLLDRHFDVLNPYVWWTKTEVVAAIAKSGCGNLIRHTRSCTRVHAMTILHSHCGRCSQCIDRRFAVIASGQDAEDPAEAYDTDLFIGRREPGPDREMALAYIRAASTTHMMTDEAFFSNYGETSRMVDFFPEPPAVVASKIFDLHQRHAAAVCGALESAIRLQAMNLLQGSLPEDCLLRLVVGHRGGVASRSALRSVLESPIAEAPEIMMALDTTANRVVFRWGEMRGAGAALLVALTPAFRQAIYDELAPMSYPYVATADLVSQLKCGNDEVLRRRVLRCRNIISKMAQKAGVLPLSPDAVIESSQRHGYRLNPDRIRLVTASELAKLA